MAYGSISNQTFNFDPSTIRINANQIDGQLTDSQIASISAAKVSGTLATNNIPNLDTSKITSGTFNASRISGTLNTNQIPNLSASKITSGILPVSRGGTGSSSLNSLANSVLDSMVVYENTVTSQSTIIPAGTTVDFNLMTFDINLPARASGTLSLLEGSLQVLVLIQNMSSYINSRTYSLAFPVVSIRGNDLFLSNAINPITVDFGVPLTTDTNLTLSGISLTSVTVKLYKF